MPAIAASFGCGLLFGLGLLISGMTDPLRVLGFLDVLGHWDPTLAFVMGGAGAVTTAGYALARRRGAPLLAVRSQWPASRGIDASLIAGAVVFGTGWGLAGVCPGPALVNLATLTPRAITFVAAMVVGMLACDAWRRAPGIAAAPAAVAADTADG